MNKTKAIQGLEFVESISCVLDKEMLANLADRAGVPERDVVRLKASATRNNENMRSQQWQ